MTDKLAGDDHKIPLRPNDLASVDGMTLKLNYIPWIPLHSAYSIVSQTMGTSDALVCCSRHFIEKMYVQDVSGLEINFEVSRLFS